MKTPPPKIQLERLRRQAAHTPPPATPIGAARLEKLLLEIRRLEFEVEISDLERRRRRGELLYLAEAQELVGAAMNAVSNRLREQHKRLSVRLLNCTTQSMDRTLRDDNDATMALCVSVVAAVKSNRKL